MTDLPPSPPCGICACTDAPINRWGLCPFCEEDFRRDCYSENRPTRRPR